MAKKDSVPRPRGLEKIKLVDYTIGEEIFSAVTHGVGAILSIAALVILIVFSVIYGDVWYVVSTTVYGASLIILYTMSTLYHAFTNKTAKRVFRILDHTSIFILIAGTYTPYALVTLRGPVGWCIFGAVWGAAILGVVLNSVNIERFKVFSIVAYLGIGLAVIFAIQPLLNALALPGVILLFAGGALYIGGMAFYAMKKYKYMHSIWHFFVLGGSILHYFSILFYIVLGWK